MISIYTVFCIQSSVFYKQFRQKFMVFCMTSVVFVIMILNHKKSQTVSLLIVYKQLNTCQILHNFCGNINFHTVAKSYSKTVNFVRNCQTVLKVAVVFCFPPSYKSSFPLLQISKIICCFQNLDFSYSYVVISHCSFNFQFLYDIYI